MEKIIYLDNAATTRTLPEVVEAMLPYFSEKYGNPSSVYSFAAESKKAINAARETIAKSIGAQPQEIFFTSGGSEADNWALIATAQALENKGKHIITSKIEHRAILHTCKYLERKGFQVTYVNVNQEGIIKLDELERAIRPDTALISIMFANNEIGTIQPIEEIGKIAKQKGIAFHTDAVQAYGHISIDVEKMHIDMLSASGHKINGPKGIGFLYIRQGMKMGPLIHGGAQERGWRAGTENVPGIVGLGIAAQLATDGMDRRIEKESKLRDYLCKRLKNEVSYCRVNGDWESRLPNNLNMSFCFIEGDSLLIMLDAKGICASSGSACAAGVRDDSHVLKAIGLEQETAHGTLRLTVSESNTLEEMDIVVDVIKEAVDRLRQMSPLYEDFVNRKQTCEENGD